MRAVLLAFLLVACGPNVLPRDAGDDPDAASDVDASVEVDSGTDEGDAGIDAGLDGGRDAGFDAGVDAGQLVTVTSERELRGVWIATYSNLDWPSSQGQSPDAGAASLERLVNKLADAGFNALFFQVRPEGDAFYDSTLEPSSRYLTGTQGHAPGWDPLASLLELAHARGLEVHAWFNPYRGLVSTLSKDAVTYNNQTVMDPGSPAVRAHVVDVVKDVIDRYDVDGVHFDDYFYPYPDAAQNPFPDSVRYQGYVADGGTQPLGDWRRDNVNALVSEVMQVITTSHPMVRFGVSPFGIWKVNSPPGVSGLSSYDSLYCDSVRWMNEGWVDYLAPQIYWATTETTHSYTALATWWAQGTKGNRQVFPGHAAYKIGTTSAWTTAEYRTQVTTTRSLRGNQALGDLHFRASFITGNTFDLLASDLYAKPALVPELPRVGAAVVPTVPSVVVTGRSITATALPSTRFVALWAEVGAGQYELKQVRGGPVVTFDVSAGTWVISAVGRGGAQSQGLRLVIQ